MKNLLSPSAVSYKYLNMYDFKDAMHVTESNLTVEFNTIVDVYASHYKNRAHRDGIQLIYVLNSLGYSAQFCLAVLSSISIRNNHIFSWNKLQGIFASDGLFDNLTIIDNIVQTRSQHYISIAGFRSGYIGGNVNEKGEPCKVLLEPGRVGGNPKRNDKAVGNDWILGFSAGETGYSALKFCTDKGQMQNIVDNRFGHGTPREGDRYWYDLKVNDFREHCDKKKPNPVESKKLLKHFAKLAEGKPL